VSSVEAVEAEIEKLKPVFQAARAQVARVLVGQQRMVDGLFIGLLTHGHILLEGAPGLAKTTAVKAVPSTLHLDFSRVQFTPDLLPADLVGTQIYEPRTGEFRTRKGPIFANIVLADEINRAPAKVQSALLEAMQERQVTLGDQDPPLPSPFLVLATQNPIEQEGTYPLPEAQTDRFLLKLTVRYPTRDEELEIITRSTEAPATLDKVADAATDARRPGAGAAPSISEPLMHYIVDLVRATASPARSTLSSPAPSSSAPAPAPRSPWPPPPAPAPSSTAAATACPRTSRRSPATSCGTASSPPTRPRPRASGPRPSSPASWTS
jgi:MoxR-like ATPase